MAVLKRLRSEAQQYARGDDRPLGGYVALLGAYGVTGVGLAALLATRRRVPRFGAGDIALLSVATFKLSRVIARDSIMSPLRAPFTSFEGASDAPSEVHESVRGSGVRKAVGELLTCPFCTGQWVATALVTGVIVAPRQTRLAMSLLTATAVADALHLAYSAATSAAG